MNKQELAHHLYGLADGTIQPDYREFGICKELQILEAYGGLSSVTANYARHLMWEWPKFSGNKSYPVPHPHRNARSAFNRSSNLWDNDEYGNNRRDLCRFIADKLMENEK